MRASIMVQNILSQIVLIFALFGNCLSLEQSPRERLLQNVPFLETYWESYLSWPWNYDSSSCKDLSNPNDVDETAYGFRLGSVPIVANQGFGVDVVTIAFGSYYSGYCADTSITRCEPYVCGLHLFENIADDYDRKQALKSDIRALRESGVLVKLAYGGDEWGNLETKRQSTAEADDIIAHVVEDVSYLGVDGIDLVQQYSCGASFSCHDLTSQQLYFGKKFREALPYKIISYTYPGYSSHIDYPYRDVLQYGHQYFDSIVSYRATTESMKAAVDLGVPKEKLVWGMAIGCNGQYWSNVTLVEAIDAAVEVKAEGYQGLVTWSLNRDTDHRTTPEQEGCNELQTGLEDGSYIHALSSVIHL